MKTAAAYIRVSTEDQVEFSPDSQLKNIREYAARNDMELPEQYIFIDEGISGKSTRKREAFNLMIGMAKKKPKPFDVILVWKFSRFARNREDSIVYKSMLRRQCDIQVLSVSEALGDDKTSILIESLIEAMDEYYSVNLAEEVKRGMTEKASRGGVVSPPAFGYDIINGMYTPNTDADTVRQIFDDFNAGMGYRKIARKYYVMGLRTKRGNPPDNRFIEYMLRNPVYIGKIRWCTEGRGASKRDFSNPNNIIVDGGHEPIVSESTFAEAQKRMDELKHLYGRYQRAEQPAAYMLKGLVKCSNCGATLVYTSTKCPSLQCHNYNRGSCHISHAISLKKINLAIINALKDSVAEKEIFILPEQKRFFSEKGRSKVNYDKLLAKETAMLERVREAYYSGADTLEEYKINKARVTASINQIKKQIEKENAAAPSFDADEYKKKIASVIEVISDPNETETVKNEVLRSVVSHIIYDKQNNKVNLFYH